VHLHTQAPTIGLRGIATAADAVSAAEPLTLCDRLALVSVIYHLILLLTGKRRTRNKDQKENATFFALLLPTIDIIPVNVIV
jgi:hypothetical protein